MINDFWNELSAYKGQFEIVDGKKIVHKKTRLPPLIHIANEKSGQQQTLSCPANILTLSAPWAAGQILGLTEKESTSLTLGADGYDPSWNWKLRKFLDLL